MNLLRDIITYVRRIVKTPSNATITDDLIIDYINRFWIMDVDARMQLFDLKTNYSFLTTPGIDRYNMPLYNIQTEGDPTGTGQQNINMYPVYQGFTNTARVNGITVPFQTQQNQFYNLWPNYLLQLVQAGTGDGTSGPYSLKLPFFPALPGHVDISGIIATGNNEDPIFGNVFNPNVPVTSVSPGVFISATSGDGRNIIVTDSGQFLSPSVGGDLYGLLMAPGKEPLGNTALVGGYNQTSNTVNYATGELNVRFPAGIALGEPIQVACYFFQPGLPRSILFYNNVITLRSPPDKAYLVELEAYLTPAAFLLSTDAVQFGYMAEYIARGAARKILADTGDVEQFQFYEPLFREQEILVWKRSQRQFTATRSQTIYSNSGLQSNYNQSSMGT